MSGNDDIDTWRQAHLRLTFAIVKSRDNIAKELAIRRYLLEEITRGKALPVPTPKKAASKSKNGAGPAANGNEAKLKKKPASKPGKTEESTKTMVVSKSSDVKKINDAKKSKDDGAKKAPHKKANVTKSKLDVPLMTTEILLNNKVLPITNDVGEIANETSSGSDGEGNEDALRVDWNQSVP
ncbi:hypothetical protein HJC23_001013 [Cyclotella cryptica]|uniref:Uncharacterized protein n=1 Tax=Cyclotella cryptica TaxID=29204 RepID=A0ABD3NZ11_9STRA|eukprot:CCRYP_018880-RA/>CCRYP_018880-RA protein AED:0.15 eAED:0.15 QI:0/-1/0/1/-1/1/1/0/181